MKCRKNKTMGTAVIITKGQHKGQIAYLGIKCSYDDAYQLKDEFGHKIWNGQFTYFPISFFITK